MTLWSHGLVRYEVNLQEEVQHAHAEVFTDFFLFYLLFWCKCPRSWFIMSQGKSHYIKQNIIEYFDKMTAFKILFLLVEVVIAAVFTTLFYVEMSFLLSWVVCSRFLVVKLNRGSSVIRNSLTSESNIYYVKDYMWGAEQPVTFPKLNLFKFFPNFSWRVMSS